MWTAEWQNKHTGQFLKINFIPSAYSSHSLTVYMCFGVLARWQQLFSSFSAAHRCTILHLQRSQKSGERKLPWTPEQLQGRKTSRPCSPASHTTTLDSVQFADRYCKQFSYCKTLKNVHVLFCISVPSCLPTTLTETGVFWHWVAVTYCKQTMCDNNNNDSLLGRLLNRHNTPQCLSSYCTEAPANGTSFTHCTTSADIYSTPGNVLQMKECTEYTGVPTGNMCKVSDS